MVDNSHKAIQLTEEVIADIERENRQFSVLEDEAVGLRRERDSERSRRQQLEKETRELQASNESGQLVLDELSGLKAILEGQVVGLISQVESTQESEGQDETVRQVIESNDDLKRRIDESLVRLQRILPPPDVVDRLIEELKFVHELDLKTLKFDEMAFELARDTSTDDASFCGMIDQLQFTELPIEINERMAEKLEEMIDPANLERLNNPNVTPTNKKTSQRINFAFPQPRSQESWDNYHLANLIWRQRNKLAHNDFDPETKRARMLLILLAASILWPALPEDPAAPLKLAA